MGALARWGLEGAFPPDDGFPWTTFAINVTGCFLLAAAPALAVLRRHPLLPAMVGTGMLGGFTTLSTYADQSRTLVADGATGVAAAYLAATLAACLAAVLLGQLLSDPSQRVGFARREVKE